MIKVGLFGFGRIGRSISRQILESNIFELILISDLNPSIENICYLLKYDSTYGKLNYEFEAKNSEIIVKNLNKKISYYFKTDFKRIDFKNIDLIIDATGSNELSIKLQQITSNQKLKIIQTNSSDKDSKKVIFGINEKNIQYDQEKKLCSSTCDANGIGSLLKEIGEFNEIEYGNITIMHPWSNYQNLLDGPSMMYSEKNKIYNNYSLGRTAQDNLIPRNTSCIDALKEVLPYTAGKLQGMCVRVPTSIVCGASIDLKLKNNTNLLKIHSELINSDQAKRNLLKVETEQLISKDFLGTTKNLHVDSRWTNMLNDNFVRFFIWYDNEWGYSSNVLRLASYWKDQLR